MPNTEEREHNAKETKKTSPETSPPNRSGSKKVIKKRTPTTKNNKRGTKKIMHGTN